MGTGFDIHTNEFEVAFSFPGEHRAYVEAVFDALCKVLEPNKIFYDNYYKAFLAAPSLDVLLQDIYGKRSKLNVVLLCEKYQEKEWCGLEARAIREIIKNRQYDKIMPIRIDDGDVDGFFGIDGYIDARDHTPKETAGLILQRVTGTLAPIQKTYKSPITNLPERNPHFSGRKDELKTIAENLAKTSKLVVKGTGGFGKTTLAVEYAHRNMAECYDTVWLANAQSEVTLDADCKEFLQLFGATESELAEPDAVKNMVKAWLKNNERYLFIFDNAEGLGEALDKYCPKQTVKGHILINSRDKLRPYPRIDLDVLSPDESFDFLKKCNPGISEDEARELAYQLGYLPLALEHAAAYMRETLKTCAEYLRLLEESGLELFEEEVTDRDPEKTVTATWLVSIGKIKSDGARQLFNMCAYFESENIPLELFIEGREKLPQELNVALGTELSRDRLLRELNDYSLLSFKRDDSGHYLLTMHRLMQLVVRDNHKNDTKWVTSCLNMAQSVFEYEYGNIDSMRAFERNVAHILAIADHAERMMEDDVSAHEKAASLYNEVGRGFNHNGKYQQALNQYSKAIIIMEKIFGYGHQFLATIYNNIGLVYFDLGVYQNALEWLQKALHVSEKVFGSEHPLTAKIYNGIALVSTR
jgi:tetratricopeptide (TPR) repeat protein